MHRSRSNEKAKDFSGTMRQLLVYSKSYLWIIIIALVLSLLSSIFAIIGPDKLKDMTNIITEGLATQINITKIKQIGFILIILYSLSMIFNYIQGIIMALVSNKIAKKMRSEIAIKINKIPLSYFDNTTIGDILSRVTNDVDLISHTLNSSLSTLVSASTLFLGSLFMMYYTNWIMASSALICTFLGFSLIIIILKHSQKYFYRVQEDLGNINGHIEQTFSNQSVVKVYSATEEFNNEFRTINNRLFKNGKNSQFFSGLMMPLMGFVGNFGYVVVCLIGAVLTVKGIISFGVIVAFMIYIRLFTNPLNQFAQSLNQLQSTAAASERVFEFLTLEEESSEKNKTNYLEKDKVKGYIEFKNVNFSYKPDKQIINNFSFKAKPGQKIAIVGPTGAGKTTIVNLLMRFYDIESGEILIDGISTKELRRDNIHDLFTMVLQDTWIFEGTIKDNIKYNQKNISDEDVVNVCKMVELDHYIKTLPKGYNTILSDIDNLSSGQKQLLTIARSLLNDKPFLIFDEATSNVDTRTEQIVQKSLDKLSKNKTSFIIAHRLSTIKNADLIIVLKDGKIIEHGIHEELLKKNGFYAELYNSQFQIIS